jgi:hypothetical protein
MDAKFSFVKKDTALVKKPEASPEKEKPVKEKPKYEIGQLIRVSPTRLERFRG